jgi:formylglycine-generating enzyme required for sulfatase activity
LAGCAEPPKPAPPAEQRAVDERPAAAANGEALVAVATPPALPAKNSSEACPEGMALVEGNYCPDVEQRCLEYADPPGRYEHFRCLNYAPSVCKSKERKQLRYCIDRHEYTPPGESLPANHQSWTDADRVCSAEGKRVCLESEWVFACEGEEMRPYPYGFSRDPEACNADRKTILNDSGNLRDLRAPSGSYSRCLSPFGVADLTGNLEEFVTIDRSRPERPAMKGAYWQPGRNHCRAAQTAHDRLYKGTETGFRCCADPG